jgi:putative PEP-CTERM system TPR-repeat lipoprotein
LLVAFIATACGVDPAAEFEEARARLDAGDLRTASIHVSNVLRADPDNAAAHVLRGRIALTGGEPGVARDAFDRARQLGAPQAMLTLLSASALVQLGDSTAALETLDAAPESSRDAEHWLLRARALLRAQRLEEASAALDRSAELGGESSRRLLALAQLAELRQEAQTAGELLERAVSIAELPIDTADALAARARHYLRAARLEDAAADLIRSADLYGSSEVGAKEAAVLSTLVQLHLSLDDIAAARPAAERLAARAPNSPVSAYAEGLVAYRDARYADAVIALQRAVNRSPGDSLLLTTLGAAHLAQGNLGQAEQHLRAAVSASPSNVPATKLLAEARLRQQRPAAALETLRGLPASARDADLDVLRGLASLEAGDPDAAAEYFERAVGQRPESQALQLELARAYLAAGRDEEALELLGDLSAGDEALNANLMTLFTHVRAGEVETGRAQAAALTDRFPREPRAHVAAAMFYQLSGDERAAEEGLRRAIELDPALARARLFLAGLLVRKGRTPEAEQLLVETLETEPTNAQVLAALAQLAAARGDAGRAESLLSRAAEAAPDALPIRYALGDVQLRLEKVDEALATAEVLQERFPQQSHGHMLEAEVHMARRSYADAALHFEVAFERTPVWGVLARLVAALRLADRAGDAEGLLRSWVAEHATHLNGRLMLAELLESTGRAREALGEYETVLEASPDNVFALNNAAWLQHESDLAGALSLAQRAGGLAPDHPAVLDTWGWILIGAGRPSEGIVHLQRAAELAPQAADIQYHFAYALVQLDRANDARAVLEPLLRREQPFSERTKAEALLGSL